jgi:hypothetical protein
MLPLDFPFFLLHSLQTILQHFQSFSFTLRLLETEQREIQLSTRITAIMLFPRETIPLLLATIFSPAAAAPQAADSCIVPQRIFTNLDYRFNISARVPGRPGAEVVRLEDMGIEEFSPVIGATSFGGWFEFTLRDGNLRFIDVPATEAFTTAEFPPPLRTFFFPDEDSFTGPALNFFASFVCQDGGRPELKLNLDEPGRKREFVIAEAPNGQIIDQTILIEPEGFVGNAVQVDLIIVRES